MSTDRRGGRPRGPAGLTQRLVERVLGTSEGGSADPGFGRTEYQAYIPPLAPPVERAMEELMRLVDELITAGALDDGNYHALDQTIQSWVEQWSDEADRAHQSRQSHLNWRAREAAVRCGEYDERIADLQARVDAINLEIDANSRKLARLGPTPSPEIDANEPRRRRPRRSRGRGGLSPTQLAGPDDVPLDQPRPASPRSSTKPYDDEHPAPTTADMMPYPRPETRDPPQWQAPPERQPPDSLAVRDRLRTLEHPQPPARPDDEREEP
jgi:hypothetical protein